MRYVGQTQRNLLLRFAEHSGKSARTGRPISNPFTSAIRKHSEQTHHHFNDTNFSILHKAKHDFDLPILESLYIKHTAPQLNLDASSYPLLTFKS